jgi:pyruvate/2-oxoglutarate dehydrogenase complex dihydrolipoamide acyltransferase (E2) component
MSDVELRLPKLAMAMVDATVQEWHVELGSAVATGQDLVSIATDKVDNVLGSPGSGTVTAILVGAGETVPVGTLLAVISS